MMTANPVDKAETVKNEANKLFQSSKYSEAIEKYNQAIELNPKVASYWSNRSFAHLKLENYGYAIADAEESIKLDPTYIKAYYRRASANMALGKFKECVRDFRTVIKFAPNDSDAKNKLNYAEKTLQRLNFEKALAYEHEQKSVVESLAIDKIQVESDYDGMRWDDSESLSLQFVMDMTDRFMKQKKIHRKYCYRIMVKAKELLESLDSVVHIRVPRVSNGILTVCGDVHGQFFDLMNIFKLNGFPSESHAYLFNGDFVDRGSFSVEVIFTLFAFKILYPECFHLNRGNHETIDMNKVYGFEGEVKAKYSEMMFKFFTEIFDIMPLGNVIENRVLVIHGGLFTRDDVTIEELKKLYRKRQPSSGLQSEMLWSDPMDNNGRAPSKRGVALQFGPDVTERFCSLNNLDMIIRSHEAELEGYAIKHNGKCVTVFSAPNYCDNMGNKGAYINIRLKSAMDMNSSTSDHRPELNYEYQKFEAVPHPPVKAMHYADMYGGMF